VAASPHACGWRGPTTFFQPRFSPSQHGPLDGRPFESERRRLAVWPDARRLPLCSLYQSPVIGARGTRLATHFIALESTFAPWRVVEALWAQSRSLQHMPRCSSDPWSGDTKHAASAQHECPTCRAGSALGRAWPNPSSLPAASAPLPTALAGERQVRSPEQRHPLPDGL